MKQVVIDLRDRGLMSLDEMRAAISEIKPCPTCGTEPEVELLVTLEQQEHYYCSIPWPVIDRNRLREPVKRHEDMVKFRGVRVTGCP